MACIQVLRPYQGRGQRRTCPALLGVILGTLASFHCFSLANAGKATTGNWIGPFSMGHTPANTFTGARATHLSILRRQTAYGDSTLVVHWHDKDKIRVWTYAYGADGSFLADTTNTARARILSNPVHNVFCAGHVNLLDGRLLIVGGTAPNTAGELGTAEVSTLDPNQPDLWTSTSNWVAQDTMSHDRWYPNATNMADGTVLVVSGAEYPEMPVFGGLSPQDSTGPFRQFRCLGLNRFPFWPAEPMNLDPPSTQHPKLRDHSSIATGQQQKRADGRGALITFGGIDETGQPTNSTWQTWDVAVDPYNSWRTELMPLTSGSPLPPARSQHAAGIEETATGLGAYELRMFVYGGLDANGNALEDVWLLSKPDNGTAATWQQIHPSVLSSQQAPGPRYGHTMVFDPGVAPGPLGPAMYYPKMFVFGGKRSAQRWAGTDTVWVLELWGSYAWHPLVLGGSKPPPRYRAAAVFDRGVQPGQTRMRMSLFGGAGDGGGATSPLLNDTWTLSRSLSDTAYADWAWYQNPAGTAAPGVYKHSMIHDEQWNRLLVFGGDRSSEGASAETNTGGETNESFVRTLNIFSADSSWYQLATTSPIVRRSGHTAIYCWPKGVNARPPERFDPLAPSSQRWSSLSSSPKFDRETYPFMFALTDGRLFYAGRGDTSEVLAASPTGPWADAKLAAQSAGSLVGEGGTAAQYLPGRIIKVGSNGTSGIANLATFTGSNYSWSSASNLGLLSRGNANATILPNGQLLVTGGRMWHGSAGHDGSNSSPPVQTPQAWTPPPVDAWTQLASALADEPAVRGYHSTAILLPDGRVLSAGGNPGQPNDDYYLGTIFEPPYLFDPASPGGNSYATRPTIAVAPRWIGHDCAFKLKVTSATGVSSVCLIRPGAPTHAFNQDQVFVPLTFTQSGSDVTVDGPAGLYTAPPGDYLLFVLDNSSRPVPSVARWVRVGEAIWPYQASDVTRPGRIVNLNGSGGLSGPPDCARPAVITWGNQGDDSTFASSGRARRLDLRYSTSSICDNCWSAFAAATQVDCEPPPGMPGESQSMEIPGLDIGSYQFRMVSQDDGSAAGNFSAMSNAKTVSVLGCMGDGFFAGGGGGASGGSFIARSAGTATLAPSSTDLEESPILAPAGGGPVTEFLRLAKPRVEGDEVLVRMRRGSTGETHLENAELVAVDHPSASEVFRVGDHWRLGERYPATSARGAHGEDISSLLLGDPSSCLVGDSGDTISIALPPAEAGDGTGTLYLVVQSGRIADVVEPGLRILGRDVTGAWTELARVLPRPRFSTLAVTGIAGNEVRLVFAGNHAVSGVGRLVLGDAPPAFVQPAASISHSRLGTLDPTALADGGVGVTLQPRDTVEVGFSLPQAPLGDARDWYLRLMGSSTAGSVMAARAGPANTDRDLPLGLRLEAPSPNPFSAGTRLRLGLPGAEMVRLDVYDLAGRRVATIVRERLSAGWHELSWNGRSRSGDRIAAGIYVCRLVTAGRTLDRKVVYAP